MTQNKEQIITDMLDNGLLSDEDAKRYLSDKSVSADEMKYIGQLILLCKKNQEEVKAGRVYSVEDLINNLKRRYMTDSVRVGDDYSKEEQEAIEAIIRRGDEDMKNGRYMSEEEFIKRAGISLDDEELKEEYEAIRRCEEGLKNGNVESWEEALKRIEES